MSGSNVQPDVVAVDVPRVWWRAWLGSITGRSVTVALLLGLVVALVLYPIFSTTFPAILGRTLFVALMLLLAYSAAGQVPEELLPQWLPLWCLQLMAIALAAPLATLVAYLVLLRGDLAAFREWGRISGFLLISGSGVVLGLLLAAGAMVRERDAKARSQALQFALEKATLERQASDARLHLLQRQIEPHFLFNTLANVQALVESGSPRAAPVLTSLIAYLRAAVPRLDDAEPTLGREAALVRSYLELMHLRMPDRLQYSVQIDPRCHALRFPTMALLTLVENAVRHGIDASVDGGRIDVGAEPHGAGGLRVWVADTGPGMASHAAPGTGLSNLRERLAMLDGMRARLEMSENTPHGLRAEIVIEQG